MTNHTSASYAALLLRVTSGALLLAHGLVKVMVFTIPGTVGFFESLGFPGFFAYLVIAGEIGGGLALIGGVYTRLTALAMLPILLGATYTHLGNGFMFSSQGGGWEYPVFWTVALVVSALLGGGVYALTSDMPKLSQKAQPAAA